MSALHVICKIADGDYAIPAADVYQMEIFSDITPVPGAPSYVSGLVQVRQQIIPVVDSRSRLGYAKTPPTSESRFVIVKHGSRLVAILVDSAREVQNILTDQFHAPPEVLFKESKGFVKCVAQLKGRIIMLMDTLKVIGEES